MVMKLKKYIRNNPFLASIILPIYRTIVNFPKRIARGMKPHPNMLEGELSLFKEIYPQCKIIVDVGSRYDVDYVSISKGNGLSYFLFEANPKFFKKLLINLKKYDENIVAENLAVGAKNGSVDYYLDSESVLKNTTAVKSSTKKLKNSLRMVRLDDYFFKSGIDKIDFLKTDIEEYDYFALIGLGQMLDACKFIQFELGIGAPLGTEKVSNNSYFSLLENSFYLYIVKDENNPLWRKKLVRAELLYLDMEAKKVIATAQRRGVGFNIFCVNRKINPDINGLTKESLTGKDCGDSFFS